MFTVSRLLLPVRSLCCVLLSAAQSARDEFDLWSSKLSRLQSKYDTLSKSLDRDFGPESEFHHLDGKCLELRVKQYIYEVCPFASSKQKEGHQSTSLGSWSGFEDRDGAKVMKFTGGQTCWQGPARSLTVLLRCGSEDQLISVEEPSKCVYEIVMQTPAVCHQEHAQVLRLNLEGGLIEDEE